MSNIGQEDFRVSIAGGKYTAIRLVGGGTRWMRYDEEWEVATRDWQHANAINSMIDELHAAKARLGDAAEIGKRAAHYGAGRQPWDDMLDVGWAPVFAAASALKYVRRYQNKNGEDDLKKGRWYYHEIITHVSGEVNGPWTAAFIDLEELLTVDERIILRQS